MNIEKIKQQLSDLEQQVQGRIKKIGTKEVSKLTGISQTELSSYMHGKRTFSYKRLIQIAENIFTSL